MKSLSLWQIIHGLGIVLLIGVGAGRAVATQTHPAADPARPAVTATGVMEFSHGRDLPAMRYVNTGPRPGGPAAFVYLERLPPAGGLQGGDQ
ncbi:hypothetical protein [Rhodophyticola porphyridii]|uniref:Uncharacterized protein n=1 Tax=Rhodophyticola porphyridii TaxID=1852017 RepID=A0A3L9YD45_9RHOB|nr:hypothetical protein [Rhodophyticola porphyridii]RMA43946.1 hypothetical protein D9R08_03255 [Rhodophyticola porphyridii]